MAKTTNLGLELTTDATTPFENWRKAQNGQGDGTTSDPKSNAQIIDEFAGAIYGVSGTTSLVAANWANGVYTLTVASLGAYDAIFFSPITSADKTAMEDADIIVSTNGTTVTFTAASTPTTDVGLNYFVARGKA
jgi:hypothetical protein